MKSFNLQTNENYSRLRELYAVMFGIPEDRVLLDYWRMNNGHCQNDLPDGDLVVEHNCGTAGCAVGWATAYPPFKELGFRMHTQYGDWAYPVFEGDLDFNAVESFFGVGHDTARGLFLSERTHLDKFGVNGETDKRRVLRRIRTVLLDKGVITQERSDELALQEAAL